MIGFIFIGWYIKQQIESLRKPKMDETLVEWIKAVSRDISDTKRTISDALATSSHHLSQSLMKQTTDIHDRLTRAAEVIGELKREAGQFSEISRSMKELHEYLKSPKLRGNIGEQVLGDLIAQMMPKNSFHFQYRFKSGEKVDAVIKTELGILPIDSKFPMENFQKMMTAEQKIDRDKAGKEFVSDVKKHIESISTKYIAADEGTTDFAIMYVPSESVYYEIVTNSALMENARSKRIYIVSPNTMYATLSILFRAFQGQNFASQTKKLFQLVSSIEQDHRLLTNSLETLGNHLGNAYHKFEDVSNKNMKLGQKIDNTVNLENEEQTKLQTG